VLSLAMVITLLAFAAIGAVIGWRRATKALYRRSLSEPNLAPGETKRHQDRRLRRRRKVGRLIGTLLYGLAGIGVGLVFLAATTMRH
jgi:hypothetical protein